MESVANSNGIVTDEEYQEFLKFVEEYNKKKQVKQEKMQDSLLYTIYSYLKDKLKK